MGPKVLSLQEDGDESSCRCERKGAGRCECQNPIVDGVEAIVAVRCLLFIVRCSCSCSFVVAGCGLWRGLWLVGFYIRRIWYVTVSRVKDHKSINLQFVG